LALTSICFDRATNGSADLLPMPVTQAGVPQCRDEWYVLLECLQLLPHSLGHLERRAGQLLQQLCTAAPPPAHPDSHTHKAGNSHHDHQALRSWLRLLDIPYCPASWHGMLEHALQNSPHCPASWLASMSCYSMPCSTAHTALGLESCRGLDPTLLLPSFLPSRMPLTCPHLQQPPQHQSQ
jgi:hypothetical protein